MLHFSWRNITKRTERAAREDKDLLDAVCSLQGVDPHPRRIEVPQTEKAVRSLSPIPLAVLAGLFVKFLAISSACDYFFFAFDFLLARFAFLFLDFKSRASRARLLVLVFLLSDAMLKNSCGKIQSIKSKLKG